MTVAAARRPARASPAPGHRVRSGRSRRAEPRRRSVRRCAASGSLRSHLQPFTPSATLMLGSVPGAAPPPEGSPRIARPWQRTGPPRRRPLRPGGRWANCTSRTPSTRVTSRPRPAGSRTGFRPARQRPAPHGPPRAPAPGAESSARRCMSGSKAAREIPPDRRASTRCRPMSRACGRYSSSGGSGLPARRRPGRSRRPARRVRPGPPGAVAQLLGGHLRAGQPVAACSRRPTRSARWCCAAAGPYPIRCSVGDRPEQAAPVVHQHRPGPAPGVNRRVIVVASARRNDDLPHSGVAEQQQVRFGGEVQLHRAQVGLGDADRQPRPRSPRPASAGLVRQRPPAAAGPAAPPARSRPRRPP